MFYSVQSLAVNIYCKLTSSEAQHLNNISVTGTRIINYPR